MRTATFGAEMPNRWRSFFKHFHRVEGTFRVDPRAKVSTVQVRIFEAGSGQAKATQSVTLGT